LKYLRPDETDGWVASIESIQDAAWHRSVLKWIRGLKRFLYLIEHPEHVPVPSEEWEMSDMDTLQYRLEVAGISWESSHVVFARSYSSLPDYLPAPNLAAFWAGLENRFSEAI